MTLTIAELGCSPLGATVDHADILWSTPAGGTQQFAPHLIYGDLGAEYFDELRNVELRHALTSRTETVKLKITGEFAEGLL